jgi:hypothetical protein
MNLFEKTINFHATVSTADDKGELRKNQRYCVVEGMPAGQKGGLAAWEDGQRSGLCPRIYWGHFFFFSCQVALYSI